MIRLKQIGIKHLLKQFSKGYENEPKKFQMLGFLKNISRGVLKDYDVYVDSWPMYSTVIAKPQLDQDIAVHRVGIYSNDTDSLKHMLTQPGMLPHNTTIRIHGMPVQYIPVLEKTVDKVGLRARFISKNDQRYIISAPKRKEKSKSTLPKEFYISSLNPENDSELIAKIWTNLYRNDCFKDSEEGTRAMKYYISTGPSVGIFNKKDNNLACWIVSDVDTSGLICITMPEYRKLYLSFYAHDTVWRQRYVIGDMYWGYVAAGNPTGLSSAKAFGFHIHQNQGFVHCIINCTKV